MNSRTIFVANEASLSKNYTFEKMIQKISTNGQLSPELVRTYGIRVLSEWESNTGKSLACLTKMRSEDRSANIYNIINSFRSCLEPYIISVKNMDKLLCIANVSLEIMFSEPIKDEI